MAARPSDRELFGRGRGHQRDPAVHEPRADRRRPSARSPAPSAAPARARRWPRRCTAPRTLVQRHHHRPPLDRARRHVARRRSRRSRTPPAPRSTTSCSRWPAARCARYLEDRDELPETSLLATVPVSVRRSRRAARRQQGLGAVRPARHRRRGPAGAAPGHGDVEPQRQGAPQGDQRRRAAGLGRVRGAAHLRPRGPRLRRPAAGREAPGRPQPGDLQRARARRCRSTSWAPGSRRSTRSARSSTAPASTSP